MFKVVRKPWGYEYPIYESDLVGLWFLCLKPGQSTSLHCHPKKKTGLVVVSGDIEVSFLNDTTRLGPADRVMIRPGLFHRSTALSNSDSFLLEIESPRDKEDLVRFADDYGREAMPYEDDSHHVLLSGQQQALQPLSEWQSNQTRIGQVSLTFHQSPDLNTIGIHDKRSTVLVLAGALGEGSREILGAGDVVSMGTLQKLSSRFVISEPLSLLIVDRGS